jgi:SAM-dependent MidA family methyltransferase
MGVLLKHRKTSRTEADYSSRFMDVLAKAFKISFVDMLEICNGRSIYDFGITNFRLLKRLSKLLPENVNYFVVSSEYFDGLDDEEFESLPSNFHRISMEEIGEVEGVMFSNRIVGALPFYIVVYRNGEFREVRVGYENGEFKEVLAGIVESEVEEYLEKMVDIERLKEGMRIEVCIDSFNLINFMGDKLRRGFVMTAGYMHDPEELKDIWGTITCYDETTHTHNPFILPGKLSIRASISIQSLIEYGKKVDLKLTGLTNYLHIFKSTVGIVDEYEDELEKISGSRYRDSRLGTVKVLIQHKGLENPRLKCLESIPSFGFWEKYNYPHPEELEMLPEG